MSVVWLEVAHFCAPSVCPIPLSPFILPGPQPRSAPTRKKVNWFPPSRELLTFFFVLTLETLDTGHTEADFTSHTHHLVSMTE